MGRAVELFGLGTEVRGTRSLDRLELPPAICPLEAGGQQWPLSDSSRLAPVQFGVPRSLSLSKAFAEGLGRSVRARRGVAGNLCRPAASSRDGVSGRELDLCREHPRISPDSCGIHGHTRIPQDGLSQTAAGRCPSVVVPHDSFPTLSSRRLENEAHCRADALATLFLFADSRSAPRTQGRRHRLSTVLGIAAGGVLCGMRGYKAIADWAQSLGQKSRERFGCRREQGHYVVPSESILRNVLIRVTPADLDRALQCWNERYGAGDESLAIDGKTMCNALDEQGQRTHVMSVVGQQSKICYTQKKWAPCP